MEITFLGTGTSHGVPSLNCMIDNYVNCRPGLCDGGENDPKHIRSRCSILIKQNEHHLLIDTSQDFKQQMMRHQVAKIDAVLFTHSHADHIFGLPDIRSYCRNEKIMRVFGSGETIDALKQRFDYIFTPPEIVGGGIPALTTAVLTPYEPISLLNMEITAGLVEHGSLFGCVGFQIDGRFGYVPDVKRMPAASRKLFTGLDLLVLNCLRRAPEHVSHMTLAETVALAAELKPKRCLLVHMSHDIHYREDRHLLPDHIDFAFDGQQITL